VATHCSTEIQGIKEACIKRYIKDEKWLEREERKVTGRFDVLSWRPNASPSSTA
jgi:hypothetical protein